MASKKRQVAATETPAEAELPPLSNEGPGGPVSRYPYFFYLPQTKEVQTRLRTYKYRGSDASLIGNYVLQPFWSRVVLLLPLWMAYV